VLNADDPATNSPAPAKPRVYVLVSRSSSVCTVRLVGTTKLCFAHDAKKRRLLNLQEIPLAGDHNVRQTVWRRGGDAPRWRRPGLRERGAVISTGVENSWRIVAEVEA